MKKIKTIKEKKTNIIPSYVKNSKGDFYLNKKNTFNEYNTIKKYENN